MDIDGAQIIAWFGKASESERRLLVGASYSDAESEWRIEGCETARLVLREYPFDESQEVFDRHVATFSDGTFFFDDDVGRRVQNLINGALTPLDRKILEAREFLVAKGLATSEFGGDPPILKMYEAIRAWDEQRAIPEGQSMTDVYAIFNKTSSLQRAGVRYLSEWLEAKESAAGANEYDPYLRLGLATLSRHTGQFQNALDVTEVVELPQSRIPFSGSVVAKLCTVRAAVMLDLAEQSQSLGQRKEYVVKARLTANKANANSPGDSSYIREVYQRINRLEDEDRQTAARIKEEELFRKVGRPDAIK